MTKDNNAISFLQKILKQTVDPKISIDGTLGVNTTKAIMALNVPKYIKIGLLEVGTKEGAGTLDNKDVLKYHAVSGGFSHDSVPWCGSYVTWVLLQDNLPIVPQPARALSWANYGVGISKPVVGCLAVKTRKNGGHVCFVLGFTTEGKLLCLGGNQGDEVNISIYPVSVFKYFRVPNDYSYKYSKIVVNVNTTTSGSVKES